LPKNDRAINREEGLALVSELKGRIRDAIAHREREIQLMEELHREADYPRYTDSTRTYMLRDRHSTALQDRREILDALKERDRRTRVESEAGC
jgi:hypothetical protein